MKKLIIFLIITIIFTVTYPAMQLEDAFTDTETLYITFYLAREVYLEYGTTAKSGLGYELKVPLKSADIARTELKNEIIKGESIEIRGNNNIVSNIIKNFNATVISSQKIGETLYIYAYSRRLRGYVTVGEDKINIQIAITGEEILIGTPLILGSC